MEPPGTATTPGVTTVAVLTSDGGDRISPTVRYRRVVAPDSESGCARCPSGSSLAPCSSEWPSLRVVHSQPHFEALRGCTGRFRAHNCELKARFQHDSMLVRRIGQPQELNRLGLRPHTPWSPRGRPPLPAWPQWPSSRVTEAIGSAPQKCECVDLFCVLQLF
jgi:hypothetical protein